MVTKPDKHEATMDGPFALTLRRPVKNQARIKINKFILKKKKKETSNEKKKEPSQEPEVSCVTDLDD